MHIILPADAYSLNFRGFEELAYFVVWSQDHTDLTRSHRLLRINFYQHRNKNSRMNVHEIFRTMNNQLDFGVICIRVRSRIFSLSLVNNTLSECCTLLSAFLVSLFTVWKKLQMWSDPTRKHYTGWRKNGAILSHCTYSENSMTELRRDELLQYYMLNTVINFLFKNFIALWRHLAKTQLLCDAQIYLYSVNKRQ